MGCSSVILTRKQQTSWYSLFSKMLTHSIFCSCVHVRKHVILAELAISVSVPKELVYATYPSFSGETFSERECVIHSVWHIH